MIVVTVELWSAITGSKTQLARMHICNDGEASSQNHRIGDYIGTVFRGRDAVALAKGSVQKTGAVKGYRRLDLHVWNLVARMLAGMGYA